MLVPSDGESPDRAMLLCSEKVGSGLSRLPKRWGPSRGGSGTRKPLDNRGALTQLDVFFSSRVSMLWYCLLLLFVPFVWVPSSELRSVPTVVTSSSIRRVCTVR